MQAVLTRPDFKFTRCISCGYASPHLSGTCYHIDPATRRPCGALMPMDLPEDRCSALFGTLTYDPTRLPSQEGKELSEIALSLLSEDYNQFIFNRFTRVYRRPLANTVNMLRSVELHKSGMPHIHYIVIVTPLSEAPFPLSRWSAWRRPGRPPLYSCDRELIEIAGAWSRGYAWIDSIAPGPALVRALYYCLKYVSKGVSSRATLFRQIFGDRESSESAKQQSAAIEKVLQKKSAFIPVPGRKRGIRSLTWSRQFPFHLFRELVDPLVDFRKELEKIEAEQQVMYEGRYQSAASVRAQLNRVST